MSLLETLIVSAVILAVILAVRRGNSRTAQPKPPPSSDAEIAALARSGQKLEAIKHYRERYGVSLVEAKEAVEALADGRAVARLPARKVELPTEEAIERAVREDRLIDAIKLYRERHGVGLKEAKEAVDAMRQR